jgi:hypothetical protein
MQNLESAHANALFLDGLQPPIPMWLSAGHTGAQFTLLASLGAAGGATDRKCCFLFRFHCYRLQNAPLW